MYKPELSVILPVYKNVEVLAELHTRLVNVLKGCVTSYEIVFVNDACPANSLLVLKNIASQDPNVKIISLEKNIGQHCALLLGLLHSQSEYSVFMDADLQDLPEDIPQLMAAIKKVPGQYSAVYAQRVGYYESWYRLLTSYIFKKIITLICGMPNRVGSFVVFNERLKEKLLSFDVKKPYVTGMIMCANLPVTSLLINRAQRLLGKSSYTSWKRLKMGLHAFFTILLLKYRSKEKNNDIPRWQQELPAYELISSR